MNQAEIEALYSQRNKNTVLKEAIRHELGGFFYMWALRMWFAIDNYVNGSYYASKDKRMKELRPWLAKPGQIEDLLILIIASIIHTQDDQTYQQVIGSIEPYMPHEDPFDRAKTAAELIALGASDRGLYSIVTHDRDYTTIDVNYWEEIEDRILDSFDWINDTCFNPPLIEKPKAVLSNRSCGYHTIQEPVILGDFTYHDENQNLETLNTLNEIEWVLDPHILAKPEVPSKPLEDRQAHENFVQMAADSKFIYRLLANKPFWFAWQYDSRGRIYSHGYHVNFQAAEYKKALLNFNHFEELTS
jgi:hypothetical protein